MGPFWCTLSDGQSLRHNMGSSDMEWPLVMSWIKCGEMEVYQEMYTWCTGNCLGARRDRALIQLKPGLGNKVAVEGIIGARRQRKP